jgi:hypothetical protein
MADPKDAKDKPQARSHPLLKGFLALVLLLFLGAVGWTTYLHYVKEGTFSFRIFDAAWWSPGVESSQPVLDSARSVSQSAHDAVWGDHGLVAEASRWWSEHEKSRAKAQSPPPEPLPTLPGAPRPTDSELPHLESLLTQAENDFGAGLDQYRASNEAPTESETRDLQLKARAHFLSTADLLTRTIPRYGQSQGHDRDRLADAKALQDYNQRLLGTLAKRLDLP